MDERSINGYGHLSPRKRSNKGENPNDNEEGNHGELEVNVFEGKYFKAELKEKREHKESKDKKKSSNS